MKNFPRRWENRAFTLVEVVLSIGLIAFAMIAILAFFPTGLSANRSSADQTRAGQLARAVINTIDSQCNTFDAVKCYGLTFNLSTLSTATETTASNILYCTYPSPNQPTISSASSPDSIYTIELRFNSDPPLTPAGDKLGAGKVNLIEVRVYAKDRSGTPTEFFFLARKKA